MVVAFAASVGVVAACKSDALSERPEAPAAAAQPKPAGPSAEPATDQASGSSDSASSSRRDCIPVSYIESVDLGEASGAVHIDGLGLVVVSDSGHRGAYRILDVKTGAELERGMLDTAGTSDDFEGLAFKTGTLYALTSNGLMSEFRRDASRKRFVRKLPPYRIGPKLSGCGDRRSNCGPNYEGLCLGQAAAKPLNGCDGAAVSKAAGTLVCLTISASGRAAIDDGKTVDVAMRETPSGCAIDERGSVWVATNIIGANTLIEVRDLGQEAYSTWARGSIEAIEHIGNEIVVFSDTQGSPSAAFRYRCARRER